MGKRTKKVEELIRRASRLQLPILDLFSMRVCEEDFEILSSIDTSTLQILALGQNKLNCRKITTFPQARWPILRQLNLASNKIGNKGVKYLVTTNLPQLQKLMLDQNLIDDAGMKTIMKAKWGKLTGLYLSDNRIYGGLHYLVKGNWKELEVLHISHLILNMDVQQMFDLAHIMLAEFQRLNNFAFDALQHRIGQMEQKLLVKFIRMSPQWLFLY